MTIPEAVQLVIRSGSLAQGGEVFALEMGEPVRILDLAEDMIRFSGLVPERDIAIDDHRPSPGREAPRAAVQLLRAVGADAGAEDHARRASGRRSGVGRVRVRPDLAARRGGRRRRPRGRRGGARGRSYGGGRGLRGISRPTRPPRLWASAPWSCSRSRSRTRSRSTVPTSASPPSSAWPFCRCSTSPRRAKSNACANGRAARPSARPSSSRRWPSTPQEVRRTPVPAPQPVAAKPQPVVANGAVKLKPAEVAALAFARAAGVHEPHEPKPHAVPPPPPRSRARPPSRRRTSPPSPPADAGRRRGCGRRDRRARRRAGARAGHQRRRGSERAAEASARHAGRPPRRARAAAAAPHRPAEPPSGSAAPAREQHARGRDHRDRSACSCSRARRSAITSLLGGDDPEQPPPPVATEPADEGEPTPQRRAA